MGIMFMYTTELVLAALALADGWFCEPTTSTASSPAAVVTASSPVAIVTASSPAAIVTAQARTEAPAFVWSGRVRAENGDYELERLSPSFARDLRKELTQLRVQVEVDRKLEGVAARLDELWVRATRRDVPERRELLVEVVTTRAQLLPTLGAGPHAASGTTAFPTFATHASLEIVEADASDRALATLVESDPRVVALVAPPKPAPREAAARTPSGDRIADLVREAVERGDMTLGFNLGDRAVPYLEQMITADPESFPSVDADPLRHLVMINPVRASEFVLRALDKSGPIWKARVLRAMTRNEVLRSGDRYWHYDTGAGKSKPTLLAPRWLDVVERLVADPATMREALPFLEHVARHDAFTPALQQVVSKILVDPATRERALVWNALQAGSGWSTLVPVWKTALSSADADTREKAILQLSEYQDDGPLIEAATHTDPVVRQRVANALGTRHIVRRRAHDPMSYDSVRSKSKLDARGRDALTRLASDADPSVRASAAWSIAELEQPLDEKVYEQLARDPDSKVRVAVLKADTLPTAQRVRIALELASDTDPMVLSNLDNTLQEYLGQLRKSEPVPDEWLEVLRARRANKASPVDGADPKLVMQALFFRDATSQREMTYLAEWALEPGSSGAVQALAKRLRFLREDPFDQDAVFDATTWAKLLRKLDATEEIRDWALKEFHQTLSPEGPDRSAAFLPLLSDASVSLAAKAVALSSARGTGDVTKADALIGVLREISAKGWRNSSYVRDALKNVASRLEEPGARRVVDFVVAEKALDIDVTGIVLDAILERMAPTSAQADAILARWLDAEPQSLMLIRISALREVGRRPRAAQGDWLVRATRRSDLCITAFDLIGSMRDESYVECLSAALRGGYSYLDRRPGEASPDVSGAALNALTRYFDRRAADIILDVAGSTGSSALRDQCFKALETIRHYEAERGRVERERMSKAAGATAVSELLKLLDDADGAVRAGAVRGLATLDAVEQMPAIVRMLKDSDERVRQAAQSALDALNAPPAPK